MPINPKKSREAHSQIGPVSSAAASSTPQHDSPALSCDLRGPQPAICRGEIAGQPSEARVFPVSAGREIDLIEALRASYPRRPSTFERVSAALNSPFWFGAYLGFVVGCFFVIVAAAVWTAFQ